MLWVAALLAAIIWVLGLESGFLGFGIHIFLLVALLSGLTALLPPLHGQETAMDAEPEASHASSVPAAEDEDMAPPRARDAEERKAN